VFFRMFFRYAIHRSHRVVACAGTRKQHLNFNYLHADGPFRDKNDSFDPVPSSKER
jgi:hypothetical protein